MKMIEGKKPYYMFFPDHSNLEDIESPNVHAGTVITEMDFQL